MKKAERGPHAHHIAELLGTWEPRADQRQLTRLELAAAGAKDNEECGWGRMSVRSRRRSVDLTSKIKEKSEKNWPKITPPTTRWLGHSSKEDILR